MRFWLPRPKSNLSDLLGELHFLLCRFLLRVCERIKSESEEDRTMREDISVACLPSSILGSSLTECISVGRSCTHRF